MMTNLKSTMGWGVLSILTLTCIATQITVATGLHAAFPTTAHWKIFVTSGTFNGYLQNAADYDEEVNSLAGLASLGGGWKALVSTTNGGAAYTHVGADSTPSAPVYNMSGNLLNNSFKAEPGGFFSQSALLANINLNENGETVSHTFVWTDSDASGNQFSTSTLQAVGQMTWVNGEHLYYTSANPSDFYPVYGVKYFEAAAVVPEPSTYLMLGTTLLFAAVARTKRKKVIAPHA